MESINPSTGELLKRFEEHSAAAIDAKLARAEAAFADWRGTSLGQRAALMKKAAEILRADSRNYGKLLTLEMGKPIKQARAEVEKCAWVCEYYADHAESHLAERAIQTDAEASFVRYDPLGPVLAVMPWNFPFWQVFRFAAPALMAGNVGVLKHASNVPQAALAIEEIFRRAGFPEGTFTTLLISARATEGVIRDRRIKAVTLTGSEAAGRRVAAVAGEMLKKTVLELGGSDPFVVLADADLSRAATVGAQARNINNGQSCIAAKRFIVERKVADEFSKLFADALAKIKLGDPLDELTEVGPMARDDLRRELHAQVEKTVSQGAKLALGGKLVEGKGYYYPVTLLTGVKPGMTAADEETFGPAAALLVAKDAEEAIAIANASRYGLGASLWTRDLERAKRLAPRIEAGAVFVNGLVKSDPRLPFGGVKDSGYGRELSEEGIREFMNVKAVWMAK
ncbi:MAG: NAD-dependent succinate-semialdehyde dehydrogenase [Myxococcales bacterium]|nr:MAG: NAD-dependent succinate-semialdehyde dehydrogenase [Myxococcales bacterium]